MKKHVNYFLILLPILLLVAGSALADPKKAGPGHGAPKNVTECGTVLTEPGNYKLVHDLLDCSDAVWIAGSDITLNLKGHEISCPDEIGEDAYSGIFVSPPGEPGDDDWGDVTFSNVTIKNGTVSNCHDGIVLVLTEDSKVMNITSTGNRRWEYAPGKFQYGTGITLWFSRNNVIMHNHTYGNAATGIGSWESSGNLFKHNTSTDNGESGPGGGGGITLENEQNSRVMCNRVHGNVDGITLQSGGSGNLLRGNLVTGNQNTGIGMLGLAWDGFFFEDIPAGNTVRSNIVEENGWFDIFEFYFDLWTGEFLLQPEDLCMNTWEKNQFQTEFGPPGCFGIPVELDDHDVCALDYDD
jgi:parallel beta-helix repeat protein